METKEIGTHHGAVVRNTIGKVAHTTTMAVGSAVNTVAGAATDAGFSVVGYIAGFAQGLFSPRDSLPNG